jgi:hypothetical protein
MEATAEQEKEIKRMRETWGRELMRSPQHCQLLFVKFSSSSSSIKWSSTVQTTIRTGCSETLCTLVTSVLRIVFSYNGRGQRQDKKLDFDEYKYRRAVIKEKLGHSTTLRAK